MKKTKQFLFLALLFISVNTIASTTIVKGKATQFKGKELVLYTYSDYISYKKEQIGFTTINQNGSYNFEFEAKETKKVFLRIEDKLTSFFIKPGMVYNVGITYDKVDNKSRVYDKRLSLNFSFPLPTELNQQIGKFNQKFDDFIYENRDLFERRNHSIETKLKAFHIKMLKEASGSDSKFVKNFIDYSIASTQNSLDVSYKKTDLKKGENTKANLYLKYLASSPILYKNPEYFNFYKAFFEGEFKSLSLKTNGIAISKAINDKASYTALISALHFPFLQDDEFKNLFMLNGLFEVSSGKYFNKKNIISILNQVKSNSKYPKHKIIASNIIEIITKNKFGIGSLAPYFELKNKNEEIIDLNQFKGKPIYINFWTNWSIPSQKEMKIMEVLYKKYNNKIEFISICADYDFNKMTNFLEKNKSYKWSFLHIGSNRKLLANYSVATFPTYILIDKNLKVVKFPAGRPGGTAERATEDNIDSDIFELIRK